MEVRIRKWGNSLAMRLPKPLLKDAHLEEGSVLDVAVSKGKLVAKPVAPRYRLEDLLRQVNRKNLHGEVDTGAPQGLEIW